MKIPVITSKKAEKHLAKIKMHHAEILRGVAQHTQRLQALQEQRKADQMMATQQKTEVDMGQQKMANDFALKKAELDIKRVAMNKP